MARHTSPASRKLIGENSAGVATFAALTMNPITNSTTAIAASISVSSGNVMKIGTCILRQQTTELPGIAPFTHRRETGLGDGTTNAGGLIVLPKPRMPALALLACRSPVSAGRRP